MVTRREWLETTLGATGALAIQPRLIKTLLQGQLLKRAIPSSGEMVPVVGLGSSATFSSVARSEDVTALKEVLRTMVERGASVFDTAPSYGASEMVAGNIASELGIANKIYWATKVNVARDGTADPSAARAQIEESFTKFKLTKLDCIQVHNLGDIPTQLGILKELKQQGRIRHLGVTTTNDGQLGRLEEIMRNEPLDWIGIGYAVDNRDVETTILPLAAERKIAVMVYQPFGRRRLFSRVQGMELPDWAKEIDATSWAQVFIKWVLSHPAVTVVTPATSQAVHMIDNIGGGIGRLPNAALRQQMAEFVDALPPAPQRGRGGSGLR